MRTPQAVRTSAFIAYALSLLAAVIVSYLLHLLLGSAGRGGFTDLNPGGLLELIAFTLTFSNALLLTRQSFKLPITTLLSGGIYAPPPAKNFALKLPVWHWSQSAAASSGYLTLNAIKPWSGAASPKSLGTSRSPSCAAHWPSTRSSSLPMATWFTA